MPERAAVYPEQIVKGDRVRVVKAERGGFEVNTLADVFWTGMGGVGGGRRGMRCGLRRDDGERRFMNAERLQKIDRLTQASEQTQVMAARVFRLLSPEMTTTTQHTQRDGSITVTGRVLVRDEQHSDALDHLPAAIHGVYPGVRYTVEIDQATGEHVYRFNCLASREVV